MKKFWIRYIGLLTAIVSTFVACSGEKPVTSEKQVDLYKKVNPFIGTDYTGNTFPGATAPFGMVQLSPDNGAQGWDYIAGYFYPDSTIVGFSHTHLQGTGAGDMYDISYFPYMEGAPIHPQYGVPYALFSHDEEYAEAGYYSVVLRQPDNKKIAIKTELTAQPRSGAMRMTFPEGKAIIKLDLERTINWDRTTHVQILTVNDKKTILKGVRSSKGWAPQQSVYYYSSFSTPYEKVEIDPEHPGVAYVYFNVSKGESITVMTSLSANGIDDAMDNFFDESNGFNFDGVRSLAQSNWQHFLSNVEVKGGPMGADTTFYTALYRVFSCPTFLSDSDGEARMPNGKKVKLDYSKNYYSTLSLWDTYRAAHPLYMLLEPEFNVEMVKGMLLFAEHNNNILPIWPLWGQETDMMIGHHSIPVIVNAYLKGMLPDVDIRKMLTYFRTTTNRDGYRGMDDYRRLGYIPYDGKGEENESVSKTLEYTLDDAAVAAFIAHALANDYSLSEKEVREWNKLYDEYAKRGRQYKNLWDSEQGFFVPRSRRGGFIKEFDPYEYTTHYTESNAWQYLFAPHHDVMGMLELMGRERFEERLTQLFTNETPEGIELPIFSTGMIGQYAHGNEPVHHCVYLFNAIEKPWLTAKYAHQVMTNLYNNTPAGLCGNEDCGQMSAWYVFSAMGLYPVEPWSSEYQISSPLFDSIKIMLKHGKTFTITTQKSSPGAIYIESVYLNGERLDRSHITYEELINGGEMVINLTDKEGIVWWKG